MNGTIWRYRKLDKTFVSSQPRVRLCHSVTWESHSWPSRSAGTVLIKVTAGLASGAFVDSYMKYSPSAFVNELPSGLDFDLGLQASCELF